MRRTNVSRSDSVRDDCCRDRGIDDGRPATTWPCDEATVTERAVLTILFYDGDPNSDFGFFERKAESSALRWCSASVFRFPLFAFRSSDGVEFAFSRRPRYSCAP